MEKMKTDVVVMGAGGAGMCAAVSAAEGGAKVIVFEKRKMTGGISNLGMGIFAVESHLQREKNLPFTRDDAFRFFMNMTKWKANARLVRAYIDKTASTIDWFEGMGVRFKLLDCYTFPDCFPLTGHIVQREEVLPHEGGRTIRMTKALIARAKELGVEMRMGTPVKKITMDGGQVAGVVAEDKNGNRIEVAAKAVVVASGGYVHNKEMLKEHGGFELGRDLSVMHAIDLDGEGIRMAWHVGAVAENMYPQLHLATVPGGAQQLEGSGAALPDPEIMLASGSFDLWINQLGERFIDEAQGVGPYLGNALVRQKNRTCYTIFDDTRKKQMHESLDTVPYLFPSKTKLGDLDAAIEKAMASGHDTVFMGNSLDEVAKKFNIDAERLKRTVEEYNSYCAKGHDDLFAKNPRYLRPVKNPKFYAIKRIPGAYGTIGGIKINERAEVINKEFNAIPGLYAAGDVANDAHTHDYSLVYRLWGSTLSFAVNTGRLAGENAARYIKSTGA
jgi:fumarate reductase flavoprotein subunit